MNIIYDTSLIQTRALFEKLTRAETKDCFQEDNVLTVIVQEGQMGKALGKNKSNARRLEQLLKRKIKIAEYNPDLKRFIENILKPLRVESIDEEDGVVTLSVEDTRTKGYIIGVRARNLRRMETMVKRYFPIKEIKVV